MEWSVSLLMYWSFAPASLPSALPLKPFHTSTARCRTHAASTIMACMCIVLMCTHGAHTCAMCVCTVAAVAVPRRHGAPDRCATRSPTNYNTWVHAPVRTRFTMGCCLNSDRIHCGLPPGFCGLLPSGSSAAAPVFLTELLLLLEIAANGGS